MEGVVMACAYRTGQITRTLPAREALLDRPGLALAEQSREIRGLAGRCTRALLDDG